MAMPSPTSAGARVSSSSSRIWVKPDLVVSWPPVASCRTPAKWCAPPSNPSARSTPPPPSTPTRIRSSPPPSSRRMRRDPEHHHRHGRPGLLNWMAALRDAGVLADGAKSVALLHRYRPDLANLLAWYPGPSQGRVWTVPPPCDPWRSGCQGTAHVAVLKSVVTQASSAIP